MKTKKQDNNIRKSIQLEIRLPQKIVIHNISKLDLNGLMKSTRTPMGNMPLMWVGGYAFIINSMPLQGKAIDLYIEGELHYTDVIFCELPTYNEIVSLNSDMTTNMFNMSKSIIHNAIQKSIKQYDDALKVSENV